jgi:hypothetical protein
LGAPKKGWTLSPSFNAGFSVTGDGDVDHVAAWQKWEQLADRRSGADADQHPTLDELCGGLHHKLFLAVAPSGHGRADLRPTISGRLAC